MAVLLLRMTLVTAVILLVVLVLRRPSSAKPAASSPPWHASTPPPPPLLPQLDVLVCETRPVQQVWTYRALEDQLTGTTLHNLCAGVMQHSPGLLGHGLDYTRLHALRRHLQSLDAEAKGRLVLWSDTDVVLNAPAVEWAQRVVARFREAARGRPHFVLFQGEPFCWAPYGATLSTTRGCSAAVLQAYDTLHQARAPHWQCARFLNSGGFIGVAADVLRLLDIVEELKLNNSRTPPDEKRPCYFEGDASSLAKLSDQCLFTHALIRHSEWVGVDVHESIFSTAAAAVPPCFGNLTCFKLSVLASKCGGVVCRMSNVLAWHRGAAEPQVWSRDSMHQQRCQVDPRAPLLIHFNGRSGKKLMKKWRQQLRSGSWSGSSS